jgi:hypothetical protein
VRGWTAGTDGVPAPPGSSNAGAPFAEAIVADFDRFGAFDEFNSPTYYGIDLYALRLWRTLPPDPYFATHGARLEDALWRSAGGFYNANLRNWCGPYTRSYHPDATRSVTMFSLWIWALLGRAHAPLPALDAPVVDHGHDLMAGPIFARLADEPVSYDLADFRAFTGTRAVGQSSRGTGMCPAWIGSDLMIGAEASTVDWGGWSQFMPATAHWRSSRGEAVLWLLDPHEVHAVASDHELSIDVPGVGAELRFRLLSMQEPAVDGTSVVATGMRVTFGGDVARVSLAGVGAGAYEIRAVSKSAEAGINIDVRFAES